MKKYSDSFSGSVPFVEIGRVGLKIGGVSCLPFYDDAGRSLPFEVAYEIWDKSPGERTEWAGLPKAVLASPGAWARMCRDEMNARLLCLSLVSMRPDEGGTGVSHALGCVEEALSAGLPLVVRGTGIADVDGEALVKIASEFRGERLLMGPVTLENHAGIAPAVLENGHSIIAESPIDINIAKQLNVMLRDLGFPPERIVSDPTTGALGYGLEYSCSIMERARIAGLGGDSSLACPFINFIGAESWRSREAEECGPAWEAVTALAFVMAGCSVAVMRSGRAVSMLLDSISAMSLH